MSFILVGCSSVADSEVEQKLELTSSEVQELLLPTDIILPTKTPEPTPAPIVDSRKIVIEELTVFNYISNTFVLFLGDVQIVYQLEGHRNHHLYVSNSLVIGAINIYESGLNSWKPTSNIYSNQLEEIKSAELYRITTFREIGNGLLASLLDEDEERIEHYTSLLREWSVHPDNRKSIDLQIELLKHLNIDSNSVDFIYGFPEEEKNNSDASEGKVLLN